MPRRRTYTTMPSTTLIADPAQYGLQQALGGLGGVGTPALSEWYKAALKQRLLEQELAKSLAVQQAIAGRRKIKIDEPLQQLIKERSGVEYGIGEEVDVSALPHLLRQPPAPRLQLTPKQRDALNYLNKFYGQLLQNIELLKTDPVTRKKFISAHKALGISLSELGLEEKPAKKEPPKF